MSITIKEISSKNEFREFIKFPDRLYSGNKYYIPALHKAQLKILDKNQNPAFEFCEAKYWLAYINNKVVGRIAGIINHNYNKKQDKKYIRFGWLDFIEDKKVLQKLMQTVETWAKQKNAEYIHGPLGFTTFDASGILIEGFNELPTSFAHYNFSYYPRLMEELGYGKDVDWIEFQIQVPENVPNKIIRGANIVQKRFNLHRPNIKKTKDGLKYADELFAILNESYNGLYGFSELTKKQIENLKKQFFSFIKPEYISLVLNKEDKLIAFGITVPSLAKALKKSNGKLFPFGYYRIWKALRKNDTVDLLLIGVKPEYQKKGVHAMVFEQIGQTFVDNKILFLETTREMENNNKVQQLWSDYNIRQHKRTRCYIKKL